MPTDNHVATLRSNIVGTWQLQYFKVVVDGQTIHPMGGEPRGIHIFTPSHDTTATILNPGQPNYAGDRPFAATSEEFAESGRRFMGWAGKWKITSLPQGHGQNDDQGQEKAAVLAYEVHVVNYPNQLGKTQERKVWTEDDGNVLMVTSLDDHGPYIEYRWTRTA